MKLTRRGWQLGLLALVTIAVGRVLAIVEMIVVGVSVLALLGVSVIWINAVRMRLRLQRSVNPVRVYAGSPAVVDLRITNLGRRTPVFAITDHVTGTAGVTLRTGPLRTAMTSEGAYRLPTRQRGRLLIGPATVTIGDPMGVVEVSVNVGDPVSFIVYPQIVPLPNSPLSSGPAELSAGGRVHALHRTGEDFYALRDYTVGDDPRRIHWRSTARLGRPMVRESEISRQNQLSVLLDNRVNSYRGGSNSTGLSTEAAAEKSFDTAVTIAASVVAAAIARGDTVKLATTSGAVIGHSSAARGVGEIFDYLAEVSLSQQGQLRPALSRLGGRGVGAVVVVMGNMSQDLNTDIRAISTLARQVNSLIALRAGNPGQVGRATSQGPITLVDVPGPQELPAAWEIACSQAGGRSIQNGSVGTTGRITGHRSSLTTANSP